MAYKTGQQVDTHKKFFVNAWIILLSTLIGLAVIIASILIGWPILMHLVEKFTA